MTLKAHIGHQSPEVNYFASEITNLFAIFLVEHEVNWLSVLGDTHSFSSIDNDLWRIPSASKI